MRRVVKLNGFCCEDNFAGTSCSPSCIPQPQRPFCLSLVKILPAVLSLRNTVNLRLPSQWRSFAATQSHSQLQGARSPHSGIVGPLHSFHVTCITALQQPLPCAKEDYGCLFNPPPTHSPSYHAHVKHRDVALQQTLNTGHWCIEISLCIPRKHSYCCLESTCPDGNLLCCLASGRLAAAIGCSVCIGRLQEMLAAKKVLSSDKKKATC